MMRDNNGWTALMFTTDSGRLDRAHIILEEYMGIWNKGGDTDTTLSAKRDATALLLSPFEAGLVDNMGLNQTFHMIIGRTNFIAAIHAEKTVGWLRNGNTILEAMIFEQS